MTRTTNSSALYSSTKRRVLCPHASTDNQQHSVAPCRNLPPAPRHASAAPKSQNPFPQPSPSGGMPNLWAGPLYRGLFCSRCHSRWDWHAASACSAPGARWRASTWASMNSACPSWILQGRPRAYKQSKTGEGPSPS
eukprot:scaffold11241_cov20-Tisochrysis_lutea.AAC.4